MTALPYQSEVSVILATLPPEAFNTLLGLFGELTGAAKIQISLGTGTAQGADRGGGMAWNGTWQNPNGAATVGVQTVNFSEDGMMGTLSFACALNKADLERAAHSLWVSVLEQLAWQAERLTLRQAHDQLNAVVQAAPLAMYALTLEGLVKQWNRAAEDTFGVSQAQAITEGIHDGPLSTAFASLRRSAARGNAAIAPHYLQLVHPGGEDVAVTLRAAPLPGGLVGTAQRLSSEEARYVQTRQQLALLESVLAHANDSVLITEAEPIDQPGPRIVYANAAFTQTTGYTLEDVLGKTPRMLQSPRTDRKVLDRIRHALTHWQSIEVELVNARKDGSEFWVELSIAPVADETGWYTHWISIQRDITERKQFAEHLDRERGQVLELAARNRPLAQVLARLMGTVERQFAGSRAAIVLPGEPPQVFTVHGQVQDSEQGQEEGTAQGGSVQGGSVQGESAQGGSVQEWLPEAWAAAAVPPSSGLEQSLLTWHHALPRRQSGRAGSGKTSGTLVLRGHSTRPPNPDERTQLEAAAQLAALVIERYDAQAALEHQALYDALTGLPNRTLFERELERVLHDAQRTGQVIAVGLMDLDRFKLVNDTLGHSVGDALLQQVALRLRGVLGSSTHLARMGGDEFLFRLDAAASLEPVEEERDSDGQASTEFIYTAAERLMDAFRQPFALAGREVFVRPSIGFSVFPQAGEVVEQLVQQADTAMYQAKRRGGGYALYALEGHERLTAMTMESALHRALERGEFVLHYQPQWEAASGRLRGAEALLRWQHPELGLVPPDDFIPLAEVTGLIVPIGEWVLRRACEQAAAWSTWLPELRVGVNLSARQFQQPDLIETVTWALHTSGLSPDRLELELTESMLMQVVEAQGTLQRLKDLGVRVAVDDFGTGYSNLAYLKQYPIDVLKIDRSFTAGVAGSHPSTRRDEALVEAVIQLAHALELEVTVEGVETQEQVEFVRQRGCEYVQGYWTGRPQPAESFGEWVKATLNNPS
jgi:diguanylate cyclase (GGDEF)-like protein/PAS domain S-box-containing protein